MKEHSWVCTLITQISLCFALYLVFNMGQPRKSLQDRNSSRTQKSNKPIDLYFMSVAGGFWALKEQTLLLKQMEKVSKAYNARFVVSISNVGEDDPLNKNATEYFRSLKVPWYTTRPLKGQGTDRYLQNTKVPYGGLLDVIIINTELFQGPSTGTGEHQLLWLTKTLEESISDWRIVVGFHPLLACNGSIEANDSPGTLQHLLLNYGVDAYLSGHACAEYIHKGSSEQLGDASQSNRGPCLTPVNKRILHYKERVNGFLLHRVSSFEFVTYLVNLEGEVVHKIELQQTGREVM